MRVRGLHRRLGVKGAFVASALLLSACAGVIGDPEKDDSPGTSTAPVCNGEVQPGPSPIRRLTRFEYDATIRDLLGDDSHPSKSFPAEEEAHGFSNNANVMGVTPVLAEQYMVTAEQLSARAISKVAFMLSCDPALLGEGPCAKSFIEKFGLKAFRRPLDADEVNDFLAVFSDGKAQAGDFLGGLRFVITGMLQSPMFLYRVETGGVAAPDAKVLPLAPYEMASRLSYLLWGSMPDDALFQAAAEGRLATKDDIEVQARRMIKDPRAEQMVAHFHKEWLGLAGMEQLLKASDVYPDFTPELRDDLTKETDAFLKEWFWRDGTLNGFFNAPYTFTNERLAKLYGLPAPSGSGLIKVDTTGKERFGFLTQGSFLALNSKPNQPSPIHRGKFVREKLLCDILPPPPNNIIIKPPDVKPGSTSRERFEQHTKDASCRQCHQLMDPIGFGFEHFDGIGKYRSTEEGKMIDAKGQFVNTLDLNGTFEGVAALASKLSGSKQVSDCVVTQWFRYGYGRLETDADKCTVERLQNSFTASKQDARELLVQLALSDAFRFRNKVTP